MTIVPVSLAIHKRKLIGNQPCTKIDIYLRKRNHQINHRRQMRLWSYDGLNHYCVGDLYSSGFGLLRLPRLCHLGEAVEKTKLGC